jgi:hypothetical protein
MTDVPVHMVVVFAEMETAGVIDPVTIIVIVFDVAVEGNAQDSEEVITQLTTSPFTKVLLVYVELFDPTFPPLSFH